MGKTSFVVSGFTSGNKLVTREIFIFSLLSQTKSFVISPLLSKTKTP